MRWRSVLRAYRAPVALLVVSLVAILVLAAVGPAAATSRDWFVVKYAGPAKNSVVSDSIKPAANGRWHVEVWDGGLTSLTIDVYKMSGSKLSLIDSQKIDMSKAPFSIFYSRDVRMQAGTQYIFSFTPAGKTGTYADVVERFVPQKDMPPVASFTIMSIDQYNRTVTVNGNASYDPDGSSVMFAWSFGDNSGTWYTGPITSHTYAADGTYDITLVVTDDAGLTGQSTQSVTILRPDLPPVAQFFFASVDQSTRTVTVNGNGSYDPDGTIASYAWYFGDGSYVPNAPSVESHTYAADGTYWVTLVVTDNAGLRGNTSQPIGILQTQDRPPVASFTVYPAGLFVVVDASASYDPDGTIIRYQWNWGDGSPNETLTSPTWSHLYAAAGTYVIYLEVMDNAYLTAVRFESVALSSVAPNIYYEFSDFFNVPYGEWWDMRTGPYGDSPINANCFNATSIADGICKVSNPSLPATVSYPYVNWFPTFAGTQMYNQPTTYPFIYAPYRMHVVGRNAPGYDLAEPVIAPILNANASPGNQLYVNWSFGYLDNATANSLTSAGCPGVSPRFNDGFIGRSIVHMSMDAQEARRVLGMPASVTTPTQIGAWIAAGVTAACATQGTLETSLQNWYASQANTKYDIFNAFLYLYTPFYTQVTNPYVSADGTVSLTVDMAAWGTETLLARWFYWGNTSYADNVLTPSARTGFLGMEPTYLEDLRMVASFDASSISFDLKTAVEYHFKLQAAPGPDGTYHNATNNDTDDVPYWTWGPVLGDVIEGAAGHPYSELSPYAGLTYVHTTPGEYSYGLPGPYNYVPATWNLGLAENWSFKFPTGPVPFVDPNLTPIPSNPKGGLVTYFASLALLGTNPALLGSWDPIAFTWFVMGPTNTGGPAGSPGAYPLEPFGAILLKPKP